jgi:hypothetical protein
MQQTKTIKIGEFDINLIQFEPFTALSLRKKIVESFKANLNQTGDNIGTKELLSLFSGFIYEIKPELLLELFKNCSAIGTGALDNMANFNKVFVGNLDGCIELALEVLEFNGFFTLSTISTISKKIPMLAPFEKAMLEMVKTVKAN